MNLTAWYLAPAALLVMIGAMCAWFERRMMAHRDLLPASMREYATTRSRRRTRIAALLVFVGALMACGNLTDWREHPLQYVIIWTTTALLALSMLCYGVIDFIATRSRWVERMRQMRPPAEADSMRIRPFGDDGKPAHRHADD
jgi:hypothetical protein